MPRLYTVIASLLAVSAISACIAAPEDSERDPSAARFNCATENRRTPCDVQERRFYQQRAELSWLKIDNAETDADKAIAANDPRLLGVYGYSTDVPGVDGADYVPNGCGLRMIRGTSDYNAHDSFFTAPRAYAQRYNARVLARTGCFTKPPARQGMIWEGYADAEHLRLSLGVPETSYDLASLRCYPGRIELLQTRLGLRPGDLKLTLASATRMVVNADASAPDQDLPYRDFAYVRVDLPAAHTVWREFGQTGHLRVDSQNLDAITATERQAVTSFLTACASRQL